jgi:hypothetical protein
LAGNGRALPQKLKNDRKTEKNSENKNRKVLKKGFLNKPFQEKQKTNKYVRLKHIVTPPDKYIDAGAPTEENGFRSTGSSSWVVPTT